MERRRRGKMKKRIPLLRSLTFPGGVKYTEKIGEVLTLL